MKQILCVIILLVSIHSSQFFNSNIPQNAHNKMLSLQQSQIRSLAFTDKSGWVIVTKDNRYFCENIPLTCQQQLSKCKNSEQIQRITFVPGSDGWVILTNNNVYSSDLPQQCQQQLAKAFSQDKNILVSFTSTGGWIIANHKQIFSHKIPEKCLQVIDNFRQGFRQLHCVTFFRNSGWLVLCGENYFASGIPDDCYWRLQEFRNQNRLVHAVAATPNDGWSVVSNTNITKKPLHPARRFEEISSIWQSMQDRNVQGISVAVVVDNQVNWLCNYGVVDSSDSRYVKRDTIFQAASLSKTFCAVSVLRLVQQQKLRLDANIRLYLSKRFVGQRSCIANNNATIQQILAHRSGIIGRGTTYPLGNCSNFNGDGGGFAGYSNTANIPSIDSILLGHPNSNSPRIEFSHTPDQRFSYSGAGYVVLQKIIENTTKEPYHLWAKKHMFNGLGMKNSSFATNITSEFAELRIASGHDNYGSVISGKRRIYPESTAAGLYTTTADLANLIVLINQKGQINGQQFLHSSDVDTMLQKQLGVFTSGSGNYLSYSHSGSNAGFKSIYYGFPYQKGGVVILSNSDGAGNWLEELARNIISIYQW